MSKEQKEEKEVSKEMSRERWFQSKRTANAKVLRWKVPELYLRNSKEANMARENEENREENSRK